MVKLSRKKNESQLDLTDTNRVGYLSDQVITSTDYATGDMQIWDNDCHQELVLDAIAWYCWNQLSTDQMPVKSKLPNRWGLYDMHGHWKEWCWDWFGEYSSESCIDPIGPPAGVDPDHPNMRVLRGGDFAEPPLRNRSASREHDYPDHGGAIRLVRPID